MKCPSCYKEVKEGYCLPCRKKLFDREKIFPFLAFDSPKSSNIRNYQGHSKQLSISGVQLKYSLKIEDKKLALCENAGRYGEYFKTIAG